MLVHKLHSLGIGKLPDPILRAWYYAIAEAENRVWPRETSYAGEMVGTGEMRVGIKERTE